MSTILFILILTEFLNATENTAVGKSIIVKGIVKIQNSQTQEIIDLRAGSDIFEGSMIQTDKGSFTKVNFFDQSTLSIGPNSKTIISKYPKKQAGIIQLISGQIRTQVEKDLTKEGSATKMYIKTKSAALGVRGTDFTTNYNEENQMTSVVTYSGEVNLAPIELNESNYVNNYQALEEAITSEKAVKVTEGQYSGANSDMGAAIPPVKISVAQFESMKSNTELNNKASEASKPTYQSITLAGVPSSAVVASNGNTSNNATGTPQDVNTMAGGFVDIKTGLYIPPPPNSVYDPNTQTFIPPSNLGSFDIHTGSYIPPAGLSLNSDGTFISLSQNSSDHVVPVVPIITPLGSNQPNDANITHLPTINSAVMLTPNTDRLRDVVDMVKDKVVEQINNNRVLNMLPLNSDIQISVTPKE